MGIYQTTAESFAPSPPATNKPVPIIFWGGNFAKTSEHNFRNFAKISEHNFRNFAKISEHNFINKSPSAANKPLQILIVGEISLKYLKIISQNMVSTLLPLLQR